ncbi:hypothetical protein BLNAU_18937 [Blattamonas nauphoetae]|uniref:Uncharacterized protein n=1 Tax=Blattamonas nauphoetae TaxID=2049346 RepID=A0ABQ9X2Z2_9EUKA|nr:hypothetical protein BLNAU_18937 [Blattamonas nauphoetae]
MPPKHTVKRKRTESRSNPLIQSDATGTMDPNIVDSTNETMDSTGRNTSINSSLVVSTTDLLTITANDRQYIRISKQIMEYEMKRKRMKIDSISDQALQEDDEISLPTSISSDWRLVLQNSVTMEDLHKGCISLFDDVDSEIGLSPTELSHAVRFLEYAILHVKYHKSPHNQLLEAIFSKAERPRPKLTSALLKLVCHPFDPLRTVALSFLDVNFSKSARKLHIAMAVIELLPQLFKTLRPREIPLNGTTVDFHRHLTSILDNVFSLPSAKVETIPSPTRELALHPSLRYLRSLITTPVCPTDPRSGFMLLFDMTTFDSIINQNRSYPFYPNIGRFFEQIRREMLEELASVLGLASAREARHFLQSILKDPNTTFTWTQRFEYLLSQVSEGRQFFDLGMLAVVTFLDRRPKNLELFFCSDDTFGLKVNDKIISSTEKDSKLLWTLFTPTQPHNATTVLTAFRRFMDHRDSVAFMKHIWNGWFPNFVKIVEPSKLPFTSEFITLHIELIYIMYDHLDKIEQCQFSKGRVMTNQRRTELDEAYHAFFEQTKDYVVHLSLHPFALDDDKHDTILHFLSQCYLHDFDNCKNKTYREEVRQEMDAFALSVSPPPFILTSELVCPLSDDEIISIVDRIVALLESDSCLDDDTILRICAFHKMKLRHIYLPKLFRKAGRTTEQYFRAFESLLSLPIDCSDRAPINYLLSPRPDTLQPTLDEWDDVDLETISFLIQPFNRNTLSLASVSFDLNELILNLAVRSLPRVRHCAARLPQPQLERLLAPSVDILGTFLIQPRTFVNRENLRRSEIFFDVSKLRDQRAIVQCLSRTGFFSRIVTGLFDEKFNKSSVYFDLVIGRSRFYSRTQAEVQKSIQPDEQKALRRLVPHFLEEGWQDALEFIFVRKKDIDFFNTQDKTEDVIAFFGTNLKWWAG